jgi:hypothetical protein
MDPFAIQAIIEQVDATCATHKTIDTIAGLPRAFGEVTKHLSLVKDRLTTAQPKLQSATVVHYQTLSNIVNHCSANIIEIRSIFQALENRCKQDQGPKTWATLGSVYLQALEWNKERRIECLMKQVLGEMKELCLHEVVKCQSEDIEQAINELVEAGPSSDDLEFNQAASVVAQQTVNKGGFGQQNNPSGGCNTFNSGYNISGGTVNFGQPPTPVESQLES